MLYESNYNQYFLEHSWGPWKKHLYISRDGESGRYTYKYPKEYYDKYKTNSSRVTGFDSTKRADENAAYYDSYYNTKVDKVINRSVKAAVKALNFGMDMKEKAEGYLNRFANAVSDAWNSAKSPDRTRIQAGKQFVSNMWNYAKNTVTAQRIAASVQNLVKGAGEAISKGWEEAKEKANKVSNAASEAKKKLKNKIDIAKARASGGTLV